MECTKCRLQYIGKSEIKLNICPNNHLKDSTKAITLLACQHVSSSSRNFNEDAKFVTIQQLIKIGCDKEELRQRLENREDFWIRTLQI